MKVLNDVNDYETKPDDRNVNVGIDHMYRQLYHRNACIMCVELVGYFVNNLAWGWMVRASD